MLLVIPAIKKNAIIPDQLVKKLNGITLIQRAIDIAKKITDNILVITDSEEISLICKRNGVKFYKDSKLKIDSDNIIETVTKIVNEDCDILVYRANAPLIDEKILISAYNRFLQNKSSIIVSVKKLDKQLLKQTKSLTFVKDSDLYFKELKAFLIFNRDSKNYYPYIIDEENSIEIESYQDWWICEKLLQRKRIVFNVIGSLEIGMGHIYHSLALAHEIIDHEVIFVCDAKYEIAVEKIASMDYKVISTRDVTQTIIDLKPDLVINDILNTSIDYIKILKENNIRVVNFEDLGDGAKEADLVINELYDKPQIEGKNFLWGYRYLALRDEFEEAIPHEFEDRVTSVLVTFGGTDQNNLTLITLESIIDIAEEYNIKIYIVCGSGYLFKDKLIQFLEEHRYKNVELTFAVGVISQIMEQTQIAFSSNGRTVYELAHMHIPSVIISHHERENTHSFASLENGFINLGVYNKDSSPKLIQKSFEKLIMDSDYRKLLFLNIKKYNFNNNKKNIVKKILELL